MTLYLAIAFLAGLFLGGAAGVIVMAALCASRVFNDDAERSNGNG